MCVVWTESTLFSAPIVRGKQVWDLEDSNPVSSRDTLAYDNVLWKQIWSQKDQQFRRYSRNCHILIMWTLGVTLTIYMTLQLMMMHHNTKFGNEMFVGVEVSSGQTLTFWPFAVALTLIAMIIFFSTEHSGLWCCITTPSLVTKCSVVQKISSRQTFTDILNLCCDLDFECSNPVFHRTLQLMMLYYWNKFGCKWTSSLEDIVKTVIFWLCKPLLWPSHWR